jgi:phospholipid transport system transporter-binding protein
MIRREGDRLFLGGPVTLANVADVLRRGCEELRTGVRTIDLGEVTELDSSLLATLFAWMRAAKANDAELAYANLPEGLMTVARLYGVADLLPSGAPSR